MIVECRTTRIGMRAERRNDGQGVSNEEKRPINDTGGRPESKFIADLHLVGTGDVKSHWIFEEPLNI